MKIAVIGSGAAGFGALHSLLKVAGYRAEITVFDIGRDLPANSMISTHPRQWSVEELKRLNVSKALIPTVSHFGSVPSRDQIDKKNSIWRSDQVGGLLNYWSSSMFPLRPESFAGWPIGPEELRPYYRKIADFVGIAGEKDALGSYFGEDFANRPSARPLGVLRRLVERVNENGASKKGKFVAGVNRLGVETRSENQSACVYCGECLSGCFRRSVFSSRPVIQEYAKAGRISLVLDKITRVNGARAEIKLTGGRGEYGGFDKVFLGAGCPGTAELALRSWPELGRLTMVDNDSYVFPIFYWHRKIPEDYAQYLSIANIVVGATPQGEGAHYAQAHISPFPTALLRAHLPPRLWRFIDPMAAALRARVMFGKLYLHSGISRSYRLTLAEDGSRLAFEKIPAANPDSSAVRDALRAFRTAINGKGFYVPPFPFLLTKTSSHYAGTLPYGSKVSATAEIRENVYVCDSSVFPASPAQPLTFSIMANAMRIAKEAMQR